MLCLCVLYNVVVAFWMQLLLSLALLAHASGHPLPDGYTATPMQVRH
jgi:hypothetical protein